jgi:hypothetical protein
MKRLKLKEMFNRQRGEGEVIGMIYLACIAAWFTHLYVCFTAAKWGFLIAGAVFFPVAIVHGFGVWLGIW